MAHSLGTPDPDDIDGTPFDNDYLTGGEGADTIWGGGGSNFIEDLTDSNVIYGDLYREAPHDRGDWGNDWIVELGSATIYCGAGEDTIDGGTKPGLIYGGSGVDRITGTGEILTDHQPEYL